MARNATIVAARVPDELARAFSVKARRDDRSVSSQLRRLMRDYVSADETTSLAGEAVSKQPAGGPDHDRE